MERGENGEERAVKGEMEKGEVSVFREERNHSVIQISHR
jgi:hypothetical protein